jgi:hypothetical protein
MTILSTEPRVNGLRKLSDVVAYSNSSVKSPSIYANGTSAPASVPAIPQPSSSDLLSRFLEQFRELEAHK